MVTVQSLRTELAAAPSPDTEAQAAVQARVDDILRPAGAMAALDAVAVWIAQWQGTATPAVESPVALIFAADHGVTAEGVSAYPGEVTGAMLAAFNAEKATVSALARVAGATVHAIDVGVGNPTGNLRLEPALTTERFDEAFRIGRETVADLFADGASNCDLLILGEMGIGNTTAAAAVSAALLDVDQESATAGAERFVGRGTGVDDAAFAKKTAVVADALARIAGVADPLEVLRHVGGTELVAIAGAMMEARCRSLPVLLDGYIATVPAVVLHAVHPDLVANTWAGHASAEGGHALILEHLGRTPLITLDLRLGEASGAMVALPLVQMACRSVTEVPTFAEWFGS